MPHPWLPAPSVLPAAHAAALAEAQRVLDERADLLAVLLAGSAARGEVGPTSDLDLYCLVERPCRQRRHLVARSGVPVEIFLNPAAQIRRYLRSEAAGPRPITAHLLTTGHVLLNRAPQLLAALRAEAAALLAAGPPPLAGAERALRAHGLRDLYGEATDAATRGAAHPGSRAAAFAQCLTAAISLHYALHRRWEPKFREAEQDLWRWDPEGARLLALHAAAGTLESLGGFVAHVLAAEGGVGVLPWDSPEEPVERDDGPGSGARPAPHSPGPGPLPPGG
jgi:hypothetical protein